MHEVGDVSEEGFLRRDFETVREFEVAIRQALPIREEALVSPDRVRGGKVPFSRAWGVERERAGPR